MQPLLEADPEPQTPAECLPCGNAANLCTCNLIRHCLAVFGSLSAKGTAEKAQHPSSAPSSKTRGRVWAVTEPDLPAALPSSGFPALLLGAFLTPLLHPWLRTECLQAPKGMLPDKPLIQDTPSRHPLLHPLHPQAPGSVHSHVPAKGLRTSECCSLCLECPSSSGHSPI